MTLLIASAVDPIEIVSREARVLERVANRTDNLRSVDCKAFADSANAWSVAPDWIYNGRHQPDSVSQPKLTEPSPLECKGTECRVAWFDGISPRFRSSIKLKFTSFKAGASCEDNLVLEA